MACSFGAIDENAEITDPGSDVDVPTGEAPVTGEDPGTETTTGSDRPVSPPDEPTENDTGASADYDPNDPFSSIEGQEVADILQLNCGTCHIGAGSQGDFGYLLDMDELIASEKIVPGSKEDSRIYERMVGGSMPPAAQRVIQTPTYSQIELVGKFIDELELPDPAGSCEPLQFMDTDEQISLMAEDMARLDADDQPFTRYLTINYSANAGNCGRELQRQRFALFKGINSVSTGTTPEQPVAIDEDETIYRVDIRDYGWDREIDLEDNNSVDFVDGWEAIVAGSQPYAVEYTGDQADDLKLDAGTAVPFMPVNAFIQSTEFGDLYYTLIGGLANLFDFEREVLLIDTEAEIADNRLMRAGFENSGVSKQDRVLNRFDSGVAAGLNYWISFDFDGGNGGDGANGFERDVANQSIFDDPLGFDFAGGEAIFSLPNGMQAYYVAAADGTRLALAPIGVVIDPAQNNGLVTNGASCHSCHNAGMITFTDTVRSYVEENAIKFDNQTFEDVMEQYPDPIEFQRQMDADSEVHIAATERAGVPRKTPDAISRVYLDFQLGNIPVNVAAGEFGVTPEQLEDNLDVLDPRLAPLSSGSYIDRNIMDDVYLDSICTLQAVRENQPVGCP
jgi:serine/threonine-protein kinase